MSIIDALQLTNKDIEKIVLDYCRDLIAKRQAELYIEFTQVPPESEPKPEPKPVQTTEEKLLEYFVKRPDRQFTRQYISHIFKDIPYKERFAAIDALVNSKKIIEIVIPSKNNKNAKLYIANLTHKR